MKIVRDTPQQLILADIPWLLGIGLALFILIFVGAGLAMLLSGEWAGLIFMVVGGGMGAGAFAVFVRRVQVIFDRPSDALVIRRRSILGYSEVVHQLADLKEAVLESTTGSKGGTLYRPTLVLEGVSAGRHPIVSAYTNTRGPRRLVDAVNRWLADAPAAQESDVQDKA